MAVQNRMGRGCYRGTRWPPWVTNAPGARGCRLGPQGSGRRWSGRPKGGTRSFLPQHDTDLLRAFALVPHVHAGALRVLTGASLPADGTPSPARPPPPREGGRGSLSTPLGPNFFKSPTTITLYSPPIELLVLRGFTRVRWKEGGCQPAFVSHGPPPDAPSRAVKRGPDPHRSPLRGPPEADHQAAPLPPAVW